MSRRALAAGLSGVLIVLADAAAGAATAPEADAAVPSVNLPQAVYLDAPALEWLRKTNPSHYARVQRILAAANYLCRPRVPDVYLATFDVQDLSCFPMLLLTSNPPQWRIRFRLDDTRYVATVWVTDDPPRALPAR